MAVGAQEPSVKAAPSFTSDAPGENFSIKTCFKKGSIRALIKAVGGFTFPGITAKRTGVKVEASTPETQTSPPDSFPHRGGRFWCRPAPPRSPVQNSGPVARLHGCELAATPSGEECSQRPVAAGQGKCHILVLLSLTSDPQQQHLETSLKSKKEEVFLFSPFKAVAGDAAKFGFSFVVFCFLF